MGVGVVSAFRLLIDRVVACWWERVRGGGDARRTNGIRRVGVVWRAITGGALDRWGRRRGRI